MYLPNTPLWWSKASAQCDFSKHSGIKRKEGERKGGRGGIYSENSIGRICIILQDMEQ